MGCEAKAGKDQKIEKVQKDLKGGLEDREVQRVAGLFLARVLS